MKKILCTGDIVLFLLKYLELIEALQCVLVSAVQGRETATCIHISPPSWPSLPFHGPPHPIHVGHHRAPT